jgi:hypothetical protein
MNRNACVAGAVLLCFTTLAHAQRSAAGRFSVQKLENKSALERDSTDLSSLRMSFAEAASHGNELSQLGQSIPTDIQQKRDAKPNELVRKLKRIEKLSRQLRDALGPDPLR